MALSQSSNDLRPDARSEPADLAALDDDGLMRLAASGNNAAFDQLVCRHQARALRVARQYLGSTGEHMVADVAQEAFVELFRKRHAYRSQGKFAAYLYRVVLSHCRMSRRSARRRVTVPLDDHQPCSNPVADGETTSLAAEQRRQMQKAVDKLSPKLRDVVALRFGADLSYAEVAETLGVPLGTVKRRVFDAVERLRKVVVPR